MEDTYPKENESVPFAGSEGVAKWLVGVLHVCIRYIRWFRVQVECSNSCNVLNGC